MPPSPASDPTDETASDELAPPERPPDAPLRTPIVGIGASAGGLEAFTEVLRHLPPTPGVALILVQHLDPHHESLLTGLLSRMSPMPVHEATDGMPVEPDHLYVIPPDASMAFARGRLMLRPRSESHGPFMPVDHLFRSLAEDQDGHAIGVVLSGGGADGTLGLEAIKAAGGITLAQEETTARHSSMPRSAIASGCIDMVLPPEGIAAELTRVGRHPYLRLAPAEVAEAPPGDRDAELARLFALLRASTGVDFTHYKRATVARRIERRMALRGLERREDFLRHLGDNPAEVQALFRDFLIPVTAFFRDPSAFEAVRHTVFPALLRGRPPDAPFRVWVPGCSTGEEAYSLAIGLLEVQGDNISQPIKILATDINDAALEKARAGLYLDNIAADVSPERLRRFFGRVDGHYRISEAIRDLCVFARHNVFHDPPFNQLDLISCRNLLIYFDPTLQRKVLSLFHYALWPGGLLFLGSSETVGTFTTHFAPVDQEHRIYARRETLARPPLDLKGGAGGARSREGEFPAKELAREGWSGLDFQKEADRVLLARYAPAAVLVDENLTVLQFRGDTTPYLQHPPGAASLDLLKMAGSGLLMELRAAIARAKAEHVTVRKEDVPIKSDDRMRSVTVEVVPLGRGPGSLCFLVLFEETPSRTALATPGTPESGAAPDGPRPGEAEPEAVRLRRELEATREYLQALVEEHEAADEELKSAHEESLASNEELQSTNEELQTAKEEMQSTNEELETVNDELGHRNRELGRLNDDLGNLMSSVSIPIVMVSRDLRVRRFTPAAEKVFRLLPADVGRPLLDIRPSLGIPDFEQAVARVIDTLTAAEQEVQDREGRWYSLRIRPYQTQDNKVEGAVVTAIDITERRRIEEERHQLEIKLLQGQKLESLGVLAGGIAHDLNNLLTPILGYAHLVRAGLPEDSEAHLMLAELEKAGGRAADLVQQILAYSGRGKFLIRAVNLSDLVRDMKSLLEAIVSKNAVCQFDLAADLPAVEADPTQVGQVVVNLMTNASEALEGHSGRVTVRTYALDADRTLLRSPYLEEELPEGRYVCLEVSDTGCGMTSQTQARIFEPFFTTKFTGRGLGLAAVLGIMRGHRGRIRVDSAPGRGSTFQALFPAHAGPAVVTPTDLPSVGEWRGSGTVLVVEDDQAVRSVVERMLKDAGFHVLMAHDGLEGVEVFQQHVQEIMVVLLDLTMPRLDGRGALKQIRALQPEACVILMSGYSEQEAMSRFRGEPSLHFLHKPFTTASLLARLRQVLESRHLG